MAKDNATTKSESITVTGCKDNLSDVEIEIMISEAKQMGKADNIEKARVEAKINLEQVINDVNHALKDNIDCAGEKKNLKNALTEAKK
ncbi:Heat shock 70 kDa protein cognate 2 [Linum grandiflorum]